MRSNRTVFSVIIGGIFIVAGCRQEPRHVEAAPSKPVSVKAAQATETDWSSGYQATGTVRAKTAAVLSSKVMGYIRQVRISPGDRVSTGQTLVVLDSRDLDTSLRQAKAAREEAASATLEVQNAIQAAKANLELADVTDKRTSDLFDKKSVSNQEYDEANAKLKVAQAAYQMALSKQKQLTSKIQQAEEAVQSAEILRGYSEIKAPFDGIITDKRAEEGALAAPGTPLLTIEQAGALRLEAAVDEELLGTARLGQSVEVKVEAADRTVQGRVSEIVPSVDPASRTFTVKIDLPGTPILRSGMFARARFPSGSKRALVVPVEAIAEQGQLQSVMVVENGVARTRHITAGERRDGQIEVLSGLAVGEIVVSPRSSALRDGARVEVAP
jgi:RND family efflux transporter MFP subunit